MNSIPLPLVASGRTVEPEDQKYWLRFHVQSDHPEQDAAYIVHALNTHGELLLAATQMNDILQNEPMEFKYIESVRERLAVAIAKAEGK